MVQEEGKSEIEGKIEMCRHSRIPDIDRWSGWCRSGWQQVCPSTVRYCVLMKAISKALTC